MSCSPWIEVERCAINRSEGSAGDGGSDELVYPGRIGGRTFLPTGYFYIPHVTLLFQIMIGTPRISIPREDPHAGIEHLERLNVFNRR